MNHFPRARAMAQGAHLPATGRGFAWHAAGALALAAAIGLGSALAIGRAEPGALPPLSSGPAPAAGPVDPSRFLLNALLVPAVDPDAAPLRWVDPRGAMRCGAGTTVHVNGRALRAGALLPVVPFELAWHMDGCQPFGVAGPRFDGGVRLTVHREDWGFSALVEPSTLHLHWPARQTVMVARSAAWTPRVVDPDEPFELVEDGPISPRMLAHPLNSQGVQ